MELDRDRMVFVIRALLENAIKFTPAGGTVNLSGKVTPDSLRLEIKDTGKGISSDDLPKIFEKFYQVDPARTGQIRGFSYNFV